MRGQVAVVTDSTAYLPGGLADRLGLRIVPLRVQIGQKSGVEGIDVSPGDVAAALARHARVVTSRPPPAAFTCAYRSLLDEGAAGVVSVHLSAELSGTVDVARAAADEFGDAVRVVDSRSTAMGLGFPAMAAAAAALSGHDADAVAAAAHRAVGRTTTLFSLDSLEHLRRGGRIGAARALVGAALSVKPILHVADGRIVPLDRVRTPTRAVARLAALAIAAAGAEQVDVAVHHLAAPERAQALAERLRAGPPRIRACHLSEVGAVVGAHAGPGLLGVVVSRTGSPGG